MKTYNRLLSNAGRGVLCFALLNISMPLGGIATVGASLRTSVQQSYAARAVKERDLEKRRERSASRLLTEKEQRSLQGRNGENPYVAGQSKWDVVYKGIDLMTGNFSTSATDMSFDGGYGIPINVTRSYSANNADEGPFGKGWTLSADVRSTATGLIKSGTTPVRSVPATLRPRPTTEDDPHIAVEPAEAVTAVDAAGTEETIQKDVDGVLTTPPSDKNLYESTYEFVTLNGQSYQVLLTNTVKTPEGTVYTYAKKGTFPSGTVPWNNLTATPEAANVLKVTSATDRHGNVTTYNYGTNFFTYQRSNGVTSENPLVSVSMPGGHQMTFTWGTSGASLGRITSVNDGAGGRTVTYTYTGTAGHGLIASATSPGGKTTTYGYGASVAVVNGVNPGYATDILTSITGSTGLTTTIAYYVETDFVLPYWADMRTVRAYKLTVPNGTTTYVLPFGAYDAYFVTPALYPRGYPSGTIPPFFNTGLTPSSVYVMDLDSAGQRANAFTINANTDQSYATVYIFPYMSDYGYSGYAGIHATTIRQYDLATQNLLRDEHLSTYTNPTQGLPHLMTRYFGVPDYSAVGTVTTTSYNFMGCPLSKSVEEHYWPLLYGDYRWHSSNPVVTRTATASYSYWGIDKYYQQKAVKDQAGRFTYTDYYDTSAQIGRKGEKYRVYDSKYATFYLDTNITPPNGTNSADYWKYQLTLTDPSKYSSQVDYDPQGRAVDAWKLQKTSTTPWSYVQTHTTYGADGMPHWGQACKVVEDVGGVNRTNETLAYTSWGKASRVKDPSSRIFETAYDNDGRVQSVTRTDTVPSQAIVSYVYGSSGSSNGQVTQMTDGLSGVQQSFTYAASGSSIGLLTSTSETNGASSYTVSYTYDPAGNRNTATYVTPNGTTRWGYYDYVYRGDPTRPMPIFQTLARLDGSGNRTSEEFHYDFDSDGRIMFAAFAQTPTLTTPSGGSYYTGNDPAASRALARYSYDPAGRQLYVQHYWQSGQPSHTATGTYPVSEAILANACDYEVSGAMNRGIKNASRYYVRTNPGSSAWTLEHSESYGYDPALDYLTSASYGDGLPNANPTWTYDPAGNRNDAVCDNLNRPTSLGGVASSSDIQGNRLTLGAMSYGWDCLNRLTSLSGSVTAGYSYRADGLRVAKSTGGVSTLYRYDGKMGIEDVETQGANVTLTRYGLGPRGVDMMERTVGSTATVGFPVYDAHGNNVGTLTRSGGGYAINDRRSYDAWGIVRAQQSAGDPKLRYCASLGHRQDDESGLIYMRSRYYEPTTGRFVSEDPGLDGLNLYIYGRNCPTDAADRTGQAFLLDDIIAALVGMFNEIKEGSFDAAAGRWMGNKAGNMAAYWTGRLLGALAANELLMSIGDNGAEIFFEEGRGEGIFLDWNSMEHGGPHVDLQGFKGPLKDLLEKAGYTDGKIPFEAFFEGFLTGLMEG